MASLMPGIPDSVVSVWFADRNRAVTVPVLKFAGQFSCGGSLLCLSIQSYFDEGAAA